LVRGTTPPQSDSGEISRVLFLNLLWQSKRCSRTAQDISVLTTPSLFTVTPVSLPNIAELITYGTPGQEVRMPLVLNSSDIDTTAILMTDLPVVQFGLETPAGYLVGTTEAISLGAIVGAGTNMLYYRFGLPLLGGGKPAHAGLWHAVLSIGDRAFIGSDVRAFV